MLLGAWAPGAGAGDVPALVGAVLSEPESCLLCATIAILVSVGLIVLSHVFAFLSVALLYLVAPAYLLSMLVSVAQQLVTLQPVRWGWLFKSFPWFIVSIAFLGASGTAGASQALVIELYAGLVVPLLTGAARAGAFLTTHLSASLSTLSLETVVAARIDAVHAYVATVVDVRPLVVPFVDALVELLLYVQHMMYIGVARGMGYFYPYETMHMLEKLFSYVIGVVMVLGFVMFLIHAGIHLLEPLLRLLAALALAPFLVASLPFASLRAVVAMPGLRLLGYCVLSFVLVPMVYGIAMVFLSHGYSMSVRGSALQASQIENFIRTPPTGPEVTRYSPFVAVIGTAPGVCPVPDRSNTWCPREWSVDYFGALTILIALALATLMFPLAASMASGLSAYQGKGSMDTQLQSMISGAALRTLNQARQFATTVVAVGASAAGRLR